MSSPTKPFIITASGPINISGRLCRKDDEVNLTEAQAFAYAAYIKPAPKPKTESTGSKKSGEKEPAKA